MRVFERACAYIYVRVGIFAHIYVRMFSVSKSFMCVVYERVTRLWIRMYVFVVQNEKYRYLLCAGKIDSERERESKRGRETREREVEQIESERKSGNERSKNGIIVNWKFLSV